MLSYIPKFNWRVCILISIPIQFVYFNFIANHPEILDEFYYPYFFGPFTKFLRKITSFTSISVGIISFYFFVIWLLYSFIKLIFYTKFKWTLKLQKVLVFFGLVYFIFMLMWGLNYHRKPIQNITNIDIQDTQKTELVALIDDLLIKCNTQRKLLKNEEIRNFDAKRYFQDAEIGFHQLAKDYPAFEHQTVSTKYGFNKAIFSYLNTGGMYFPFSAEANINATKIGFDAPFTICHEMSHQLGFASEQEANYLSFLACQHNPHLIFKYSANLNILYYALGALHSQNKEEAKAYYEKLDPIIKQDSDIYRKVLAQYDSKILDFLSSTIYDVFLKANNQDKGIKSYGLVVDLMLGEYRKNKLIYSN